MKLKGVIYVNEPEDLVFDRVRVRVLTEPGRIDMGGYEYLFDVTTAKGIEEWMKKNGKSYYASRAMPLLVVERLDKQTVTSALEDILQDMDEYGLRVQ